MDTINLDIWEIIIKFLNFPEIRNLCRISKENYRITKLCVTHLRFTHADVFNPNHKEDGQCSYGMKFPPWNILSGYSRLRSCNCPISTSIEKFNECLDMVSEKLSQCVITCPFESRKCDKSIVTEIINKFCHTITSYPQKSLVVYFYDPLIGQSYHKLSYLLCLKYNSSPDDSKFDAYTINTLFRYYDNRLYTFYGFYIASLNDSIDVFCRGKLQYYGTLIVFDGPYVKYNIEGNDQVIPYSQLI